MRRSVWFIFLFLAQFVSGKEYEPVPDYDWGPVASRITDLDGIQRFRFLGPLYEDWVASNRNFRAFRPIFSRYQDKEKEHKLKEWLWPVGTQKVFRKVSTWRFLSAFGRWYDVTDENSHYYRWVLPFLFYGRNQAGEDFFALFPIYGKIHNFLRLDEISFVLFPIYSYHSINNVRTKGILWPFYSRTDGKGIYRFRLWPFVGQSKHREHFQKKFFLWPIWSWAKYAYPTSSGEGYILFPLWGRLKLSDQESWMFIPPLIRFHKGEEIEDIHAPWPFLQIAHGKMEKFYLWPLWGRKEMPDYQKHFFLWPIFRTDRVDRGKILAKRFYALPFIYHEKQERVEKTGDRITDVPRLYHKLWPLASYVREGDRTRFRILDLWPQRLTAQIERNYAPWFTFYQYKSRGGDVDEEAFWGLYRNQARADGSFRKSIFPIWTREKSRVENEGQKWSILKGLLSVERKAERKQLRILYFLKFGNQEDGS